MSLQIPPNCSETISGSNQKPKNQYRNWLLIKNATNDPPNEDLEEVTNAKNATSAQKDRPDEANPPEAKSRTYWKAVKILSSSSSSHGSMVFWETTKERRVGVGYETPSPLLSSTPPATNADSLKKTIPKLNFLCVCVWVCWCVYVRVSVCSFGFFFSFSFLVWCQMFQLSNAAQHRWWWI